MTIDQAEGFAKLALAGIDREFPNKTGHVTTGTDDLKTPREMHPVFYGHFDWHSSVHGHWMLVRLLKQFPYAPFADEVGNTLQRRFSVVGLALEAEYFRKSENKSFERMYGWAWALRLAVELRSWDDPRGREWAKNLEPLEKEIVGLAKGYLPKLDWPVRCGFHPESSFPLGQMLDYARAVGDSELEKLLIEKSKQFYMGDRDYPVTYEPSGNDFFSPGLNVADLMRRVLPPAEFATWLEKYLPGLAEGKAGNLLTPVKVSDPTDGHLIHLAGLNLNRAWTMQGIASVLPEGDPRKKVLLDAADKHTKDGLELVASGHYEGDHWLASFAVYLLSETGR
ncbi:DUF2891 domain-containing protein [Luteolibacter flavescens]|uniref:DUF2891 domain-containing protein n=2 Tax=Luteolibacter flavescens TaxID=1859460 RepID=A0ABT3FS51_9BACT|nr:DUF2891 domain-containing protein [Luteolibacter flavescens]